MLTGCVPPSIITSPIPASSPIPAIKISADYNNQFLDNDKFSAKNPRKVLVTSSPRDLISEDIVRQQILKSASIISADRTRADIIIEIQSYNVEINIDGGSTESILLNKSSVPNGIEAFFKMPESSTYSIDIQHQRIVGAYEVAYTLQTPVATTETPHVMRDSIELKTTTCSQPKVINAFGGVSVAGFWASDQLKAQCLNGGSTISRQGAQAQIENAIGRGVRGEIFKVPESINTTASPP